MVRVRARVRAWVRAWVRVRFRVRVRVRVRVRSGVRVMVSKGTPRRHSRMSMPPSFGPSTTTAASYL